MGCSSTIRFHGCPALYRDEYFCTFVRMLIDAYHNSYGKKKNCKSLKNFRLRAKITENAIRIENGIGALFKCQDKTVIVPRDKIFQVYQLVAILAFKKLVQDTVAHKVLVHETAKQINLLLNKRS